MTPYCTIGLILRSRVVLLIVPPYRTPSDANYPYSTAYSAPYGTLYDNLLLPLTMGVL